MKLKLVQRIYRNIARHAAERAATDLQVLMKRRAAERSLEFLLKRAPDMPAMQDAHGVMDAALEQARGVKGCFCEFGVFKGDSLRRIADRAPDRTVHGFDSFEGLPETWRPDFQRGTFRTPVPSFRQRNIRIHKGWFDDTVPPFVSTLNENVALVHVDCDLYSSTRTVLTQLLPYMVEGTVLLFDEYFNYPGWEEHEHRALHELLDTGELQVHFIAYNRAGEQVAAVVTGGRGIGRRPGGSA